jgi:hypothetical protein
VASLAHALDRQIVRARGSEGGRTGHRLLCGDAVWQLWLVLTRQEKEGRKNGSLPRRGTERGVFKLDGSDLRPVYTARSPLQDSGAPARPPGLPPLPQPKALLSFSSVSLAHLPRPISMAPTTTLFALASLAASALAQKANTFEIVGLTGASGEPLSSVVPFLG